MSVQSITAAISAPIDRPSAKLLLIILANYTDEHGACFPSHRLLAKDTGLSPRAIKMHLAWLEENGFISRESRTRQDGARTSDRYIVAPVKNLHPPVQNLHHPVQNCLSQGANIAPLEPITEPIETTVSKNTGAREELERVLDKPRAKAVLEHRQSIKKKLTPYAARLLATEFAKCPDPNAAADAMIAGGWQGFKASWIAPKPLGRAPPQASGGWTDAFRENMNEARQ